MELGAGGSSPSPSLALPKEAFRHCARSLAATGLSCPPFRGPAPSGRSGLATCLPSSLTASPCQQTPGKGCRQRAPSQHLSAEGCSVPRPLLPSASCPCTSGSALPAHCAPLRTEQDGAQALGSSLSSARGSRSSSQSARSWQDTVAQRNRAVSNSLDSPGHCRHQDHLPHELKALWECWHPPGKPSGAGSRKLLLTKGCCCSAFARRMLTLPSALKCQAWSHQHLCAKGGQRTCRLGLLLKKFVWGWRGDGLDCRGLSCSEGSVSSTEGSRKLQGNGLRHPDVAIPCPDSTLGSILAPGALSGSH